MKLAMKVTMKVTIAAAILLTLAAGLAGCSSTPPNPKPETVQPSVSVAPTAAVSAEQSAAQSAAADDSRVLRFEQSWREAALEALGQGRLADAALAWEVLTVLRPAQAEYQAQLTKTQQAIDASVRQRLARAGMARASGEGNAAERGYLEVLALDPANAAAVQALRSLEQERKRASVVGRFAAPPANLMSNASSNGSSNSSSNNAAIPSLDDAELAIGQRNLIEHARLLAGQGEIDAAIALLSDASAAAPRDIALRRLLAQWHWQRAERSAGSQPAAARTDLERALALDPQLQGARDRLKGLPAK